jgi:hypothetical protein
MGTGDSPHEEDDRGDHHGRSHHPDGQGDGPGESSIDDAATDRDQNKQEGPEYFREESSPLVAVIPEVERGYDRVRLPHGTQRNLSVDELFLVPSNFFLHTRFRRLGRHCASVLILLGAMVIDPNARPA